MPLSETLSRLSEFPPLATLDLTSQVLHIDAKLALSFDEKRRLAAGMSATATAHYTVLYDLAITPDDCDDAHVAAGLLTVFCDDVSASAWSEIAAIVHREISDVAQAARAAA